MEEQQQLLFAIPTNSIEFFASINKRPRHQSVCWSHVPHPVPYFYLIHVICLRHRAKVRWVVLHTRTQNIVHYFTMDGRIDRWMEGWMDG